MRIFFTLMLCAGLVAGYGQKRIDSLKTILKSDPEDTLKITHYLQLSTDLYITGNTKDATKYAEAALALAKKLAVPVKLGHATNFMAIMSEANGDYPATLSYSKKAADIYAKLVKEGGTEEEVSRHKTLLSQALANVGYINSLMSHYDTAFVYCDKAMKCIKGLNNLVQERKILNVMSSTYMDQGDFNRAIDHLKKALDISTKLKNNADIAEDLSNIAAALTAKGDYSAALEYNFKALKIMEEVQDKRGEAFIIGTIGAIYLSQKNYDKAIEVLKKAIQLNKENGDQTGLITTYANMANALLEQKKNTEALTYLEPALKMCAEIGDKLQMASVLNNMGDAYLGEKKYDKAEQKFLSAIKISKTNGITAQLSVTFGEIGLLYTETGRYKKAFDNLYRGLALSDSIDALDNQKREYEYLSQLYERSDIPLPDSIGGKMLSMEQMRVRAKYYYERFVAVRDQILNNENTEKSVRAEMNYEYGKKESLAKAEQEKKDSLMKAAHQRKQIIYISIILVLALLVAGALMFVKRQKLLRQKNELIFNQRQELLEAEKQKTEEELIHAKEMLINYTNTLIDKSAVIEEYQKEIEKLRNLKSQAIYEEKVEALDDLNKATLLTNEDWEKFKDLFEQVYKGFFVRLKDKFPELTNAEIRLVSLVKLKLETKQMANMLGVSPETITKTKYRLRKKVNLSETQDIEWLAESV